MTLPQAAYATAVHTALATAGLAPDETAVSVTESVTTLTNTTCHDLSIVLTWDSGLRLAWRHVWGWSLDRPDRGDGPEDLGLPLMAAPAELVAPVRAALDGRSGSDVPEWPALWADRLAFDRQLADWEDRSAP
ncbi:hypothetical protein ACIQ7D_17980 [Streptomyces sp. NPDC096310]|uniref:hypothetical protein n=1 Tax=Streptomyces sp. NPDC096310 TaxID=3366082 RepID=UPI0037F7082B